MPVVRHSLSYDESVSRNDTSGERSTLAPLSRAPMDVTGIRPSNDQHLRVVHRQSFSWLYIGETINWRKIVEMEIRRNLKILELKN